MRGKRAKQYRKLMQQYGLTFGFREPYQVLGNFILAPSPPTRSPITDHRKRAVDAQMIEDTERFKMDLVGGLERTLSGKVKPSTQHFSLIKKTTTAQAIISSDNTMLYSTPLHQFLPPCLSQGYSHRHCEDDGTSPLQPSYPRPAPLDARVLI